MLHPVLVQGNPVRLPTLALCIREFVQVDGDEGHFAAIYRNFRNPDHSQGQARTPNYGLTVCSRHLLKAAPRTELPTGIGRQQVTIEDMPMGRPRQDFFKQAIVLLPDTYLFFPVMYLSWHGYTALPGMIEKKLLDISCKACIVR